MKLEPNFPIIRKPRLIRARLIFWARWPFVFAAAAAVIVNLAVGGKAWSAVAAWGLWMAWSLGLAPDMVEYNRISQFAKGTVEVSILLILIDRLLAPGWAITVVPIVCFSGLIVSAILFLTNYSRQRQNSMPMMLLTVMTLISAGVLMAVEGPRWENIAMGGVSVAVLAMLFCYLTGDAVRNLKKHFHIK